MLRGEALGRSLQAFSVSTEKHEVGSRCREARRDAVPDSAPAPGNKGDSAREDIRGEDATGPVERTHVSPASLRAPDRVSALLKTPRR